MFDYLVNEFLFLYFIRFKRLFVCSRFYSVKAGLPGIANRNTKYSVTWVSATQHIFGIYGIPYMGMAYNYILFV